MSPAPMTDARAEITAGVAAQHVGVLDRAIEHFETALALAADADERAEAFVRLAHAHRERSDWPAAIAHARRAAEIARAAGRPEREAEALNSEAIVHQLRGDYGAAVALFDRILELTTAPRLRGVVLQNLGTIAALREERDQAEDHFIASARYFREAGYATGEAVALNNLTCLALDREQFEQAERLGERALAVAREVGDGELIGIATLNCAEALAGRRQFERAELLACEALGAFQTARNQLRRANCLRLLGRISVAEGALAHARRCFEHALRIAEPLDAQHEIAELRRALAELPSAPADAAIGRHPTPPCSPALGPS